MSGAGRVSSRPLAMPGLTFGKFDKLVKFGQSEKSWMNFMGLASHLS
jgi:hypothetical protein